MENLENRLVICSACVLGQAKIAKKSEPELPTHLLRSRLSTLLTTCRSECKAEQSLQVVTSDDKPLAPSSLPSTMDLAAICHNSYYVLMTENHV